MVEIDALAAAHLAGDDFLGHLQQLLGTDGLTDLPERSGGQVPRQATPCLLASVDRVREFRCRRFFAGALVGQRHPDAVYLPVLSFREGAGFGVEGSTPTLKPH